MWSALKLRMSIEKRRKRPRGILFSNQLMAMDAPVVQQLKDPSNCQKYGIQSRSPFTSKETP
jgi:hypothetical protein